MSFLRTTACIAIGLGTTLLLAGIVHATDVSMADGTVNFRTPDSWLGIMETQGDPEVRVFQVPDPSLTGKVSLARISVTVKQAADVSSFNQYKAEADAKALSLPGYKVKPVPPGPNSNFYTATENGVQFSYVEHYWFKNGHAIQLRCVRPTETLAGAAWKTAFDKGCDAIAAELK
ncbi:MAG: hypothetical protein OQK79_13125 [Rhodanobacter sp.]|jgi:hypothetical protein|nr:hypothetical protein [Rhodanobacter sp.]